MTTNRAPTERAIQKTMVAFLHLVLPSGSIVAATVNEQVGVSADPISRARFGNARKASGVLTGFPDLSLLLPGGRLILVEVKRPITGTMQGSQRVIHARLRGLGFVVIVATTLEELADGLERADVPVTRTDIARIEAHVPASGKKRPQRFEPAQLSRAAQARETAFRFKGRC